MGYLLGICCGTVPLMVLSQVDPLSGGAGWVGAGLLGAVLSWLLLLYLPSKDKQADKKEADTLALFKGLIDGKDTHTKQMSDIYLVETHRMQEAFEKSLLAVVSHCEKENTRLEDYMHDRMHAVLNALGAQTNKLDLIYHCLADETVRKKAEAAKK